MLEARDFSLSLGGREIIRNLNLWIDAGRIVTILGPNGSGKSTLLRGLSRNLKPDRGQIYFDGQSIQALSGRDLARQLAVLSQTPGSPGDLTIRELVEHGRFPHRSWWRGETAEDGAVVDWALEQTGLADMAGRTVTTLSGGERQRAWIAMALAQRPRVLLLDEPTTFLDISHQLEILELIASLNHSFGLTVVMVLHDINHAARYSDYIAVLERGQLYAAGRPEEVITQRMLREVFRVEADIWSDGDGRPVCMARALSATAREDAS